jgi:hypothetical protein
MQTRRVRKLGKSCAVVNWSSVPDVRMRFAVQMPLWSMTLSELIGSWPSWPSLLSSTILGYQSDVGTDR